MTNPPKANVYEELNSTKRNRLRQKITAPNLEGADQEQVLEALSRHIAWLNAERDRSERYFLQVQQLAGKVATLRHENNKLRHRFEKERRENELHTAYRNRVIPSRLRGGLNVSAKVMEKMIELVTAVSAECGSATITNNLYRDLEAAIAGYIKDASK